jgi:hypothetical protein
MTFCHMPSVLVTVLFISIITLAGSHDILLAASSTKEEQLPIEKLEALSQFENMKGALDELTIQVERMGRVFEQKCLSAFGHTAFCRCIKDNRPVASSFESYILAVTRTKEELGFKKLNKEDQKLVLRLREARDQCVLNGKGDAKNFLR